MAGARTLDAGDASITVNVANLQPQMPASYRKNDLEKPFRTETLPEATGGALTAEAIPITEAGLKGGEVMRLLSQGVFEVAHCLGSYVAAENPAIEGADLSSIAPDFTTMRAVAKALSADHGQDVPRHLRRDHPGAAPVARQQNLLHQADQQHRRSQGPQGARPLGDAGRFVEGASGVAVTIPFCRSGPGAGKGGRRMRDHRPDERL